MILASEDQQQREERDDIQQKLPYLCHFDLVIPDGKHQQDRIDEHSADVAEFDGVDLGSDPRCIQFNVIGEHHQCGAEQTEHCKFAQCGLM